MRIITGKFRGRKLRTPSGKWPVRPTTDRAKEGLYNVLAHRFDLEEVSFLDLFGGTGSISIEAVSRGCEDVTYVDSFGPSARWIADTAREWQITDALTVIRADVFRFIQTAGRKYDLIFADPPYDHPRIDQLPALIKASGLLKADGWFILEHDQRHHFEPFEDCFMVKRYGKTYFSFFH